MFNEISISGYKCLKTVSVKCSNLSVLVGPNASGKSSVLQTLLLLRQSADKAGRVIGLHLSGPLYEAGTAQDALHPESEHRIGLQLKNEKGVVDLLFSHDRAKETAGSSRYLLAQQAQELPIELFDRADGFAYLNAERIGPRVSYPLPPDEPHLGGLVGKYGEFTAAILARASYGKFIDGWNENLAKHLSAAPSALDYKELIAEMLVSEGRLDLLSNIILGWILPGSMFEVTEHEQTDSATLRFIRAPSTTKSSVRSTHVGFGLTYALPIITAALALRQGGLLLVENPEAHLHPFSQSRIGVFLAVMAATGRQIFLETHSDHVINGIRLAVKYGLISTDKFNINFFSPSPTIDSATVTSIQSDSDGRLDRWPDGFFDQIENDLSRL